MANPFVNLSDEKVMILYQQGNEQAFEVIFTRYKSKVYSYVSKKVYDQNSTDDVFQLIFAKFHRSRHLYDAKYELSKWVYTISKSVIADHLRGKSRLPQSVGEEGLENIAMEDDNDQQNIDPYLNDSNLSEKEQMALRLRYKDDKEFEEIARRLKVGEAGSRKLVSRAIQKLKKVYGGSHG